MVIDERFMTFMKGWMPMATTKKQDPQQYNDQSIKALKGAERVRTRPSIVFGSDGLEGCEHAFFEILSNAVDEAREGHGNEIKITVFQDKSIEVDDHGRGVPLGWNEAEGRWNWDLIYCELYAGGKYENNSGKSAYEYSLGLNGVGACATQYASEYMIVKSYDGKFERSIRFRRGVVTGELQERPLSPKEKRTGTVVLWRPDLKVFNDIDIPREFFREVLHRQAVVNSGITFILHWEEEDETFSEEKFSYEKGISDYLLERVGDSALTEPVLWHLETKGRDRDDKEEYKFKADISFCISNKTTMIEYYHNSSFLEHGGSPDQAVKLAFPNVVEKYIKANPRQFKCEGGIVFNDIAECLVLVINEFSTLPSYENQTKKAVNNPFIKKALNDFLKQKLEYYFTENPKAAEVFANQVLINKHSRESAERARNSIKKTLNASIEGPNRVDKFISCRSKDPNVAELYIVEGDSAATSCKLGRKAEYQAIMPVRGKTLNCLKSDYDKIFKSDIITDLLKVIGCGVELDGTQDDESLFELKKLRWSKIIICTDADEDGFQIRTLLLTLFYRLLPTLLQEKKVFIAETPLFEITTKDEKFFAYDEFEKADILKKIGHKRYTLQRSKGLGENDADMMWQTTMNPETRRLISVSPADAAQTEIIFDTLLGDNIAARKQFIAENGSKYMKDIDV